MYKSSYGSVTNCQLYSVLKDKLYSCGIPKDSGGSRVPLRSEMFYSNGVFKLIVSSIVAMLTSINAIKLKYVLHILQVQCLKVSI